MIVRAMLSLVVAILCAGAVQAGDYEDGVAAYERRDYTTALTKFRSAAQQGDAAAQSRLGSIYSEGKVAAQDYKEAVRWYVVAATQGNALAQTNLGVMYEQGLGVTKDQKEAVFWYKLAAAQGYAPGQRNIGKRYYSGEGVEQDFKEAVSWFQLAAAQGDADAQNSLGVMYVKGQGVAQDYKEAVYWQQLAAAQGNALAQNNLGFSYQQGRGVAQDYKEAARWYQLAATQGNAAAQNNLGMMYERGQGVERNEKESVRWYQLASAQGNASAQFNLAIKYDRGLGVAQDYKEAVRLYRLAAAQGYAFAQTNLGTKYYRGEGVVQDYREAARWYRLAAAQGDENAKRLLVIADRKASENSPIASSSNQTDLEVKPTDAESERKKRQETEELLAQERRAKTAELEAATKKRQELETRLREAAKVKTITTLNVDTKRTNIEEVDRLKSLLITEISDEVMNEAIYADRSWLATGQINDQKVTFQQGDGYTRIERIVNRLLDSVNIDSTKWAVRVVDTEEKTENAFVTGGRIIYVYTGLIESARSDDELSLVLGHEIGHSLLKHNKERVDNSLATIVGSLAKLGAILSKNEQSKEKLEFVGDAITTFYKRDHEREADAFGAYIANKAGYRYGEGKNFFVRTSNRSRAIEAQNEAQLAQATQEINSQFENFELQKQRYNSNVLYRTRANAEIVNQVCQLAIQNAERLRGFQKQKIKNLFIRTHPVDDERISNLEFIQSYMSCRTGEQGLERIGVGSFVLRALDFKPQCR